MEINKNSEEMLAQRLNELYLQELSWRNVAERLGVSTAYLSDVINGRREAGPKILKPLNLRLVGFYMDST